MEMNAQSTKLQAAASTLPSSPPNPPPKTVIAMIAPA
jgi:hypothetical protein